MNRNTVLLIVVIVLAVFGFWYLSQSPQVDVDTDMQSDQQEEMMDTDQTSEEDSDEVAEEATVTYTDDGFSPREVTISQGGTVTFVNESGSDFWPASAMHPTHTVYPGSDIELCVTAQADTLFDACGAVSTGGVYEFTFTEEGEWGYHDHLNASHFGKVVVE